MVESKGTNQVEDSSRKIRSLKKGKAVPNYLRTSTGSCHDLCKYGRRHKEEEKPWRLFPRVDSKKAGQDKSLRKPFEHSTTNGVKSAEPSSAETEEVEVEETATLVTKQQHHAASENNETIEEVSLSSRQSHQIAENLNLRRNSFNDHHEGDAPRKIKFRQGNGFNGDFDCNSERKSETITLKHQDLQEKKGPLGLYNNIIKETANRLLETRISKVRALVGAFETVISIHEND